MADISMCANQTCPLKETCYRFNATPSERQSYSDFKPDGDKCEFFILLRNQKKSKRKYTSKQNKK